MSQTFFARRKAACLLLSGSALFAGSIGCSGVERVAPSPSAENFTASDTGDSGGLWYRRIPSPTARERQAEFRPTFPANGSKELAFAVLLRADDFSVSGAGIGASESPPLLAFYRMLDEPDAADAFEELVRRAELAGQPYGLCGLYLKDHKRLNELAELYRLSDRKITVWGGGCMGEGSTVGSVVVSTAPNAIRLNPGETVDAVIDAYPNQPFVWDIVGGAYPTLMQDGANRGKQRQSDGPSFLQPSAANAPEGKEDPQAQAAVDEALPWFRRVQPLVYSDPTETDTASEHFVPLSRNPSREEAFQALLSEKTFAVGPVGLAGEMPSPVRAYGRLLLEPDAADAFADLQNRGTFAGQAFALCGLYETDPSRFAAIPMEVRLNKQMVPVMYGEVRQEIAFEDLYERIETCGYAAMLKAAAINALNRR